MATDKQIEANRQNAQLCTGPKTEEGKLRSSQNALKTGLYSKSELLITESREALDELIADFHTRFAPATPGGTGVSVAPLTVHVPDVCETKVSRKAELALAEIINPSSR